MFTKWFIYPPHTEMVIALRFDYIMNEGHIGGSTIDYDVIENIVNNYFKITLSRKKVISNNKIKFKIKLSNKKFKNALDKLDKDGFVVERTTNHERVMR